VEPEGLRVDSDCDQVASISFSSARLNGLMRQDTPIMPVAVGQAP
jgi:hypothetical protein